MDDVLVDDVWDEMYQRVGEDLRAVTQYRGTTLETRMRDDVRAQYTAEEDSELITETIVNQMGEQRVDAQFKTGGLNGLIRVFDTAWVVTCANPANWKAGVLVSIQRGGSQASIEDTGACIRFLNQEIIPQF